MTYVFELINRFYDGSVCFDCSPEDLVETYKIILLFMEKQNLCETCTIFKKEAKLTKEHCSKISNKCLLIKPSGDSADQISLILNSNEEPPPRYSKFDNCWNSSRTNIPDADDEDLKRKFKLLQDEHKKLMVVATELTSALQINLMGQTENIHKMLDSCKHVYPDLFALNSPLQDFSEDDASIVTKIVDETVEKINIEPEEASRQSSAYANAKDVMDDLVKQAISTPRNIVEDKDQIQIKEEYVDKNEHEDESLQYGQYKFNLNSIKENLLRGNEEMRINLLKLLRLAITKCENVETREQILTSFIKNDVLFLTNLEINLVKNCLNSEQLVVKENMARLINMFACFRDGRNYLNLNEKRVLKTTLIPILLKSDTDNLPTNMLIATIQKLSLSAENRQILIDNGIIEHVLHFMKNNYKILSEYCAEYCYALLMNLFLEKKGRDRCELNNLSEDVLSLIKETLQGEKDVFLPYVSGILYSLLTCSKINTKAKEEGLDKSITNKINQPINNEAKKQLEFIIKSRFASNNISENWNYSTENNDANVLEKEIDENGDNLNEDYLYEKLQEPLINLDPVEEKNMFRPTTPNFLKTQNLTNEPSTTNKDVGCSCEILRTESSSNVGTSKEAKTSATKRQQRHRKTKKVDNWKRGEFPFCYMDECKKLFGIGDCRCYKCTGANRYRCSCYDALRRDIEEDFQKEKLLPKIKQLNEFYNNPDGNVKHPTTRGNCKDKNERCGQCRKRSCECAFVPRPKINRTP